MNGDPHHLMAPRRLKGLAEGLLEIEPVLKVLATILVSPFHDAPIHQVEDNLPKIPAVPYAPFFKHGAGHRTKLLQGIRTDLLQELMSTHLGTHLGTLLGTLLGAPSLPPDLTPLQHFPYEFVRGTFIP